MLFEKRHIAYPTISHYLEKGNWPSLDWIIKDIQELTPEAVLDNESYMSLAAYLGGFGADHRSREEWLQNEVEWKWFRRRLIAEDLPCILKSLANPVGGVSLERDYNDQVVTIEHRYRDQFGHAEHSQGHPYWPWRVLLALGVVGGRLHEPRHWLDLLPKGRREWGCHDIAEAMTGGRMDGKLTVELWRAEATFHATPAHRRQFGLDPEKLIRLSDAVGTSSESTWHMAFDSLGARPIALVAREQGEGAREAMLSRIRDRDLAAVEEAMAGRHLERRLDDERHEAFDVADAHVRLRAALTYWTTNHMLRS